MKDLSAALFLLLTAFASSSNVFADVAPPPETKKSITFNEAIEEILGRSTDIAQQRAQVSETFAASIPARTSFLPNLGVQLSRFSDRDDALHIGSVSDSINVVGKLNLFRFGADVKGWQAASGDESTQGLKFVSTTLKTEQNAVLALISELQSLLDAEVISSIVKKEKDLLKIGRERYSRGLMPSQEVDQIAVDMENANARLADIQVRETSTRSDLVALLGHAQVEATWPWVAYFESLDKDAKKQKELLGSEADLEKRPDVQAALKNFEAQSDRASQRVRQALPSLDSSLTYSRYGLIAQPVGSTQDPQWVAALTLSIPLFDQLNGYSSARVQHFEEVKADISTEQARRAAMADWTSARQTFMIALSTAIARDKTVQISRKLYNDSLRRFQLGRINANDLAFDETRLTDSEILANSGWAQTHLTFAQLCHSRGLRLGDCLK